MKRQTNKTKGLATGLATTLLAPLLMASSGAAQEPKPITFQGELLDSAGVPVDGQVDMTFFLYADSPGFLCSGNTVQPTLMGLLKNSSHYSQTLAYWVTLCQRVITSDQRQRGDLNTYDYTGNKRLPRRYAPRNDVTDSIVN